MCQRGQGSPDRQRRVDRGICNECHSECPPRCSSGTSHACTPWGNSGLPTWVTPSYNERGNNAFLYITLQPFRQSYPKFVPIETNFGYPHLPRRGWGWKLLLKTS